MKVYYYLLADKQIVREKISGSYIYFSVDTDTRKKQELARNNSSSNYAMNLSSVNEDVPAHELKAAIILFFSILDEKQRRLYAGIESIKIGHGGDTVISSLLGIAPHTVAKGFISAVTHSDFYLCFLSLDDPGKEGFLLP